MACPYFYPTQRLDADLWPHRQRLPLGDGFRGRCTVGEFEPAEDLLRDGCNLGYARQCPHLPQERAADAVRFSLKACDGRINVIYVLELACRPVGSGILQYDPSRGKWPVSHPQVSIQRMAECLVKSRRSGNL